MTLPPMGVLAIFCGGIDLMPFHLILGKDTIIKEYVEIGHFKRIKFVIEREHSD